MFSITDQEAKRRFRKATLSAIPGKRKTSAYKCCQMNFSTKY